MSLRGKFGRIQPAPENFIPDALIDDIRSNGLDDSRRRFLWQSFAAASAALVSGSTLAAARAIPRY
jgi:hypothetical protein